MGGIKICKGFFPRQHGNLFYKNWPLVSGLTLPPPGKEMPLLKHLEHSEYSQLKRCFNAVSDLHLKINFLGNVKLPI